MIYRRRIATPFLGFNRYGLNRYPFYSPFFFNQYPIRSSNIRNPVFSSPFCRCTCGTGGCNCNCFPFGRFPIARPY